MNYKIITIENLFKTIRYFSIMMLFYNMIQTDLRNDAMKTAILYE